MWANISKCPRKAAAAHGQKHDSESAMIINGGGNDRESPSTSGSFDCADNNSGEAFDLRWYNYVNSKWLFTHFQLWIDRTARCRWIIVWTMRTISKHHPWCMLIVRPVFGEFSPVFCWLWLRLFSSFYCSLVSAMSMLLFRYWRTLLRKVEIINSYLHPNRSYLVTSIIINNIFELTVLIIMTIAVIFAYIQTIKLDVNHHPISKLDDVLLFVAIPAFFLETIFSMIPAVVNGSYLNIAIFLAQITQVLVQTPFIIDGLRRCSNATELRKKKPGRELVIFLTIANVSLWVFYTFSVKTEYTGDERYGHGKKHNHESL